MDEASKDYIVRGRHSPEKRARAYEFRRAMTPEERILWNAVRANRCGGLHIRRQQIIDGFLADFYCHAKGLAIEVDGGIHDEQPDEDARRTAAFALRGLSVLRFSNERITQNLRLCLTEIQGFGSPNPPSPPVTPAREGEQRHEHQC